MIKVFYVDRGRLGEVIHAYRKSNVWGGISSINTTLNKAGLDMNNILTQDGNNWKWTLEKDVLYTVSSLRKDMYDITLYNTSLKTVRCKDVLEK